MKKYLITIAGAFLLLQQFISSPLQLLNPLSSGGISGLAQATIKVQQKINTYHLTEDIHFLPQASAASPYDNATSYALIDYDTGKVITEKGMSQRVPVASLTKIMSAVVALDLVLP